ncbi:uncharacterized protein LOC128891946 isoform X1 [Hylaeus anthracinus]|uniref:uncharacterized protein LOC128891946 isoform X1 n=1 Tax=Hylaeus anthracinus TaxID=313031 RepID=UPI0023B8F18B|nr:uncharacterized protein LOC128891946 isoform X1 [Hylaeus anthracinus]
MQMSKIRWIFEEAPRNFLPDERRLVFKSSVIFGCVLLVRGESPTTSYSVRGDANYDYNTIKDGHRDTTDFYSAGSSGHTNSRSQGNLEESLRANTYSGFSPSSHDSGFQGFSSSGTSSYFGNDPVQSSFDGYTNANNGDSTFDAYTHSNDQAGSDFSQFSSNKHKNSAYMKFTDSLPGASIAGSFSEIAPEGSAYREYSGDAFRGHAPGGFMDGEQSFNREPTSLFNAAGSDYSFGKHKEGMFGIGGSNKYPSEGYPLHSDTRYIRGNHGSMGREFPSPGYVTSSSSSPYSSIRGSSGIYSSGKYSKYNKFLGDYAPGAGLNYLSKDQDADYLFANYGKGKVAALKDSRPSSSYGGQAYLGGPSYLNKIASSYKSKPSFMSYPSSSLLSYPSMSSLHSSFSGNSYADGPSPMLRRYRSSSGYIPGHGSMYSGFY